MSGAKRTRIVALLLPLALGSCLGGKRISDIDAPAMQTRSAAGPFWSVPPGVVVTPAERGARSVDGLYPATAANERCCWISPSATIHVAAAGEPVRLALDVFVPTYPFFEARPQTLTLALAGTTHRFSDLGPGVHRLRIDVARAPARDGIATIVLHTDRSFVPAREGINADTRALGLILLDVALRPRDASP